MQRFKSKYSLFLFATVFTPLIAISIYGRSAYCSDSANSSLEIKSQASSGETNKQALQSQLRKYFAQLPLYFEPNQGQADPRVVFLGRGNGYCLFLTNDGASFSLGKSTQNSSKGKDENVTFVTMRLLNGNLITQIAGEEKLSGESNYFRGRNSRDWHTGIPHFTQVRYREIYKGIDLVFRGNLGRVEYDFILFPGASPQQILIEFQGADALHIDEKGRLVLQVGGSTLVQPAPYIYQESDGMKQQVAGRYVLKGKYRVGFHVARFNNKQPLIIDPVFIYSTYLGGTVSEDILGITVDSTGNAYVTGTTWSTDFPTTSGSIQPTYGGGPPGGGGETLGDAFIVKINPAMSGPASLIYATYLGGSSSDTGYSIAVDSSGNAYVAGHTYSNDFPVTLGARQVARRGSDDGFISKLDASGATLLYSTFLGGSGTDWIDSLVVDSAGNAYVTGTTNSTDFPVTPSAYQLTYGGGTYDAFVAKINSTGTGLVYATYLGGNSWDEGDGISIDSSGNAYIAGSTWSDNFPKVNAIQQTRARDGDVFITKLNDTGSGIIYSTYLGGTGLDKAVGIAVDSGGNAYVTGSTASTDFPTTAGAFQRSCTPLPPPTPAGYCAASFVSKISASGTTLAYSSYFGGTPTSGLGVMAHAIAVDANGRACIVGQTDAFDTPTKSAFQSECYGYGAYGGCQDGFIAQFSTDGSNLVFSSYMGCGWAMANAIRSNGDIYVAGQTGGRDFLILNGAQTTPRSTYFVVLGTSVASTDLQVNQSVSANSVSSDTPLTFTMTVSNQGPVPATQVLLTTTLPQGSVQFLSVTPSQGTCSNTLPISCSLGTINAGSTATVILNVRAPSWAATLSNKAAVAGREIDTDQTNNTSVTTVTVTGPAADLRVNVVGSPDQVMINSNVVYTITVVNNGPSEAANVTLYDETSVATIFDLVSFSTTKGTCYFPSCTGFACLSFPSTPQYIDCNLGTISSGGVVTITMTVKMKSPGGTRTNTAYVSSITTDSNSGNNSATVTTSVISSGGSGSGVGGGGGCFIATAAFGSSWEPHVMVLRTFRDKVMLKHSLGRSFVNYYYRISPPIANFIAQHDVLKTLVKWCLTPMIGICWMILHIGYKFTVGILSTFIILLTMCVLAIYRRWSYKR
jgi:uncharacterized repeat protein (TIGR01451 family)